MRSRAHARIALVSPLPGLAFFVVAHPALTRWAILCRRYAARLVERSGPVLHGRPVLSCRLLVRCQPMLHCLPVPIVRRCSIAYGHSMYVLLTLFVYDEPSLT